ncbi:alpha-ribazole phosphatase [Clostridium sp. D2Q-11]|uniref:Alpha-ribazole phosphatase n=1 Tax=Anaeromonas frigoriresistens TaxID=2683708 RepID=A0A942UXD8_9FIRM|nr:alpha-ribazole phosphatase [Anaeromonas frigoriresistens]MBS4538564.1 alpha-ribazole phosphatase [Anaeromonas frigoriresistens]
MKLILVRHPETEANYHKLYIGQTESQYTDKGKAQVEKILNEIDYTVDVIYTSPMSRCKLLAEEVSKKLGTKIMIENRINEINFGVFEGKDFKEVKELYPDIWENWTRDYINYSIPKGESLIDVYSRVEEFLESLKNTETTNICITHGGIIQTIITLLLELDIDQRWHFRIYPGTIVEISYNEKYGILEKINNTF